MSFKIAHLKEFSKIVIAFSVFVCWIIRVDKKIVDTIIEKNEIDEILVTRYLRQILEQN